MRVIDPAVPVRTSTLPRLLLPRLTSRLKDLTLGGLAGPDFGSPRATCKIQSCNTSAVLRSSAARKPGIWVGSDWYCSSPCFTEAIEMRLLKLTLQQPGRRSTRELMPLNLLLMARGWLTHSQSIDALLEQQTGGGKLDEVLLRLGFVTEEQITVTRATQAGYPVFSPPTQNKLVLITADESSAGSEEQSKPFIEGKSGRLPPLGISIPHVLVEHYSMLPLHYTPDTKRLLLGFVTEVDYGALYAIEQMTGCRAEPSFVTPSVFRSLLHREESRLHNEELKFDRSGRAAEMARVIGSHAVRLKAEEAHFGRTRDFVWARLKSEHREVDLLFKLDQPPSPATSPRTLRN